MTPTKKQSAEAAIREIENLIHSYAERIDAADLEGVADLTAHGRVAASPQAKPEQLFEGRERVLALYRGSMRIYNDGRPHTKHVTTNSVIEVDEGADTASAFLHWDSSPPGRDGFTSLKMDASSTRRRSSSLSAR